MTVFRARQMCVFCIRDVTDVDREGYQNDRPSKFAYVKMRDEAMSRDRKRHETERRKGTRAALSLSSSPLIGSTGEPHHLTLSFYVAQ